MPLNCTFTFTKGIAGENIGETRCRTKKSGGTAAKSASGSAAAQISRESGFLTFWPVLQSAAAGLPPKGSSVTSESSGAGETAASSETGASPAGYAPMARVDVKGRK